MKVREVLYQLLNRTFTRTTSHLTSFPSDLFVTSQTSTRGHLAPVLEGADAEQGTAQRLAQPLLVGVVAAQNQGALMQTMKLSDA
jgi:hypothetical protein